MVFGNHTPVTYNPDNSDKKVKHTCNKYHGKQIEIDLAIMCKYQLM